MRSHIIADGRQIFFESRINPARDAERALSQVDFHSTDVFILFGYTTKEILTRLLRECSEREPRPAVLCVDPNGEMLEIVRESVPGILSYAGLRFFKVQEPDKVVSRIEELFYLGGNHYPFHFRILKNLSIIGHWPDEYAKCETMISGTFRTLYANLLTMDFFKNLWMHNLWRNTSRIAREGEGRFLSLAGLKGRFKDAAALIVNAGPSLDGLHEVIRGIREKVFIIAVDTAVRNLALSGIEPDFILSLDSQLFNYQDFLGIRPGKARLVMEITASQKIPDVFPGPVYFFHTKKEIPSESGTVDFIEPHYRFFTERYRGSVGLQSGGSVSTTAIDLAVFLGFSKIVLASLDLGYTDDRLYCRSTYVDRVRSARISRFGTYDTAIARYVISNGIRRTPENTRTSPVMEGYRRWFEESAKILRNRMFHLGGARIGQAFTEDILHGMKKPSDLGAISPAGLDSVSSQDTATLIAQTEKWLNFKRSPRFSVFLADHLLDGWK